EAGHLPQLLNDLSRQQHVELETIVVDGGSRDETLSACQPFLEIPSLNLQLLNSEPGRGRQMNMGANTAAANDYLFLHADSRIDDPGLLYNAKQHMDKTRARQSNNSVAGHFPLRFITNIKTANPYYFYECKTHLNRPDCINGDQGYWLAKEYFDWLGGFDDSLPYMEDAKLAARIFDSGQWITLPGTLATSARRFETEGFTQRQIINSFLCNFHAMGVDDFFHHALEAYQAQHESDRLPMRPLLKLAHQQMNGDGITTAVRRWYQTGAYIAGNAWQLAFALDCRRNRKQQLPPGDHNIRWLVFYDNHIASIMNWSAVKLITAFVTIIWFYSLFVTQ
ncbi:MAG: glycosyltransferase, partial [Gammaproteobacteria bacterium]